MQGEHAQVGEAADPLAGGIACTLLWRGLVTQCHVALNLSRHLEGWPARSGRLAVSTLKLRLAAGGAHKPSAR